MPAAQAMLLSAGDAAWPPSRLSQVALGAALPARLRLPGWIIIGSTGRKSGKTELATGIIRAFCQRHVVVGVKVTAVAEGESGCPRGGEGCGACATLEPDFEISEERGEHPGKDTTRMLEAGAREVFWLRCRKERIHAALGALLSRLDPRTLVVAESNSLAQVVEPDLFFMVRHGECSSVKPTAADVISLAQRVVTSAHGAFDLNLRHLTVVDGVWHLVQACAAILAGGKSSRMGQDKSLLPVQGKPLIRHVYDQLADHFDEVLISTNEPQKHAFLGARLVPDRVPESGPLMGIASAVEAARHERVFVVACDIPVIDLDTVKRMLALAAHFDCVIGTSPAGHEPLFAVYRKSALPAMRDVLTSGERRISAVFPLVRTVLFDLGPAPWYRNLNTREELAAFLAERREG